MDKKIASKVQWDLPVCPVCKGNAIIIKSQFRMNGLKKNPSVQHFYARCPCGECVIGWKSTDKEAIEEYKKEVERVKKNK